MVLSLRLPLKNAIVSLHPLLRSSFLGSHQSSFFEVPTFEAVTLGRAVLLRFHLATSQFSSYVKFPEPHYIEFSLIREG